MAKEKAKAARAKEKACGGCRYLRLTTGARAKVCITFYCRFFQWAHWVLFFARLPARCFSYNIIFLITGKGKGKGKGSSTFSKTYVNPELAQDPASAVGGDSAEGSTSGGGDAAATSVASASGTTTVVPLGKGKGGKGKGKGTGKGGPAPAYSKVWERALTKDEGLLTPR